MLKRLANSGINLGVIIVAVVVFLLTFFVLSGLAAAQKPATVTILAVSRNIQIGEVITARVMNINSDERRIGLSIKRMEMEDDQSLLSDYVNNMGPATSSFGEILRENLQGKINEE